MTTEAARQERLSTQLQVQLHSPAEHAERWLSSLNPASEFVFLARRAALARLGPEEVQAQAQAETGALHAAALDAACGASGALRDLQARFLGDGWRALLHRFSTLRARLRPEPPFPPGVGPVDVEAFILLGENPAEDETELEPAGRRALTHLRDLREAHPDRYERLLAHIEEHDRLNEGGQIPRLEGLVSDLDLGRAFRTSWQLAFGGKARARPKLPSHLAQAILVAAGIEDRLMLGELLHHLGLLQTAVKDEPPTDTERSLLRKEVENGRAFWIRAARSPTSRAHYATAAFVLELVEWTTHQRLGATRG